MVAGTGSGEFALVNDYLAYLGDRNYSPRTVRAYGFDLRLAFEDDRRNYDMFHAEGVPCVYIHSGYYD